MAVPDTLTGLRTWLRASVLGADGSAVSTWADQSGNGHDGTLSGSGVVVATGQTPAGGKAVSYNGTGRHLFAASALGNAAATYTARGFYPGEGPELAFDGNTATTWTDSGASGQSSWIAAQGPARTVESYAIRARFGWTGRSPKSWTLVGSNDGTNWTTLDTRSNQTFTDGGKNTYAVTSPGSYTHYRLNISAISDGGSTVNIVELEGLAPAAAVLAAEAWVVVKSVAPTTTYRGLHSIGGSSSSDLSHYPSSTYEPGLYERPFSNTRTSRFAISSPSVNAWRIYRVRNVGGAYSVWIDNALQVSGTAVFSLAPNPTLGANWHSGGSTPFSGHIAEVLWFDSGLTETEAANLIWYLNNEHGLSVPGGEAPGVVTVTGTVPAAGLLPAVQVTGIVTGQGQVSAQGLVPGVAIAGTVTTTGQTDSEGLLPAVAVTGTVTADGVVEPVGLLPTVDIEGTFVVGAVLGQVDAGALLPGVELAGDVVAAGAVEAGGLTPAVQVAGVVTATGTVEASGLLPVVYLGVEAVASGSVDVSALLPQPSLVGTVVTPILGTFEIGGLLPVALVGGRTELINPDAVRLVQPGKVASEYATQQRFAEVMSLPSIVAVTQFRPSKIAVRNR